jgi:hypothetical protein
MGCDWNSGQLLQNLAESSTGTYFAKRLGVRLSSAAFSCPAERFWGVFQT